MGWKFLNMSPSLFYERKNERQKWMSGASTRQPMKDIHSQNHGTHQNPWYFRHLTLMLYTCNRLFFFFFFWLLPILKMELKMQRWCAFSFLQYNSAKKKMFNASILEFQKNSRSARDWERTSEIENYSRFTAALWLQYIVTILQCAHSIPFVKHSYSITKTDAMTIQRKSCNWICPVVSPYHFHFWPNIYGRNNNTVIEWWKKVETLSRFVNWYKTVNNTLGRLCVPT